jgi:hypothetical protein
MAAERTQRLQISHRDQSGIDDFFHHGIHYRSKCTSRIRMYLPDSNYQRPLFFLKAVVPVSALILRIQHAPQMTIIINVYSVSPLSVRMTKLVSLLIQLGVNRDLITATAVIAGLGSFMFGFLTNLPVALAYDFSSYPILTTQLLILRFEARAWD